MKHFKSFVKEKFQIPPEDIDDLLFKTQVIVNNDIKKNLKLEKDIEQGNSHLEILRLLSSEWNEKRVESEFVFRVTDNILKIHSSKELS
jgi:predicted nucleotidyltransferase